MSSRSNICMQLASGEHGEVVARSLYAAAAFARISPEGAAIFVAAKGLQVTFRLSLMAQNLTLIL